MLVAKISVIQFGGTAGLNLHWNASQVCSGIKNSQRLTTDPPAFPKTSILELLQFYTHVNPR